jgi:serine phosphatase RsbU (regulator of sigma subunit)
MAYLKIVAGERIRREFHLEQHATVIGSSSDCDILLVDPRVSRAHARIEQGPDGFYLEDLGSKHGTMVNGARLTGRCRLEDGDLIEVGGYRLEYRAEMRDPGITPTIVREVDAPIRGEAKSGHVNPEERLKAILEIGKELMGVIELDAVLNKILAVLFRVFPQAERGFFLFRDAGANAIHTRAGRVRDPASDRLTISRTIYDYVTSAGVAILCEDLTQDKRFGDRESVKESQARTLLCVPLWDHQRLPFGVLQIDTRDVDSRFRDSDLDFLVSVAGSVTMAVENARLHEVDVRQRQTEQEGRDARAVQISLLPEKSPTLPGYEFWHVYEPARSVGGDYFDYRPIGPPGAVAPDHEPQGRWAIAVGDVAGKGMPAALLVVRLSTQLRFLLTMDSDPGRVVERLNQSLCAENATERFITFLLVALDGTSHELSVVSAGHMGPLIRRKAGPIEVLGEERNGPPLGIIATARYEPTRTALEPGDLVVLYTDGVTEARNGEEEEFGMARLQRSLAESAPSAASVGMAILDAVRHHVGGAVQSDDLTLLCFGRT